MGKYYFNIHQYLDALKKKVAPELKLIDCISGSPRPLFIIHRISEWAQLDFVVLFVMLACIVHLSIHDEFSSIYHGFSLVDSEEIQERKRKIYVRIEWKKYFYLLLLILFFIVVKIMFLFIETHYELLYFIC